jgi:predicted anti-sigma-YlaC factor YlaD
MKCDRAQELISARIDREIIFEGEVLDDHLQNCADCRNELEGMRRLETILWRAYEPERQAADVFVDKVKASLQARGRNVNHCTVLLVDDKLEILLPYRGLLRQVSRSTIRAAATFIPAWASTTWRCRITTRRSSWPK